MKLGRLLLLLLALALLLAARPARAERSWSIPNLLPFGKKEAPSTAKPRAKGSAGVSRFWRRWSLAPRRAPNMPSTLTKFNNSTKRILSKTKDMLTPGSSRSRSTAANRSRGWAAAMTSHESTKKKSVFTSLFQRDEPSRPPETVRDYLALERPGSKLR